MMKKSFLVFLLMIAAVSIYAITIHDIQYTEDASGNSPYLEQVVTVEEAVVTAVGWKPNGGHASFFIADPEGGEWSGIYVYDYDEAYVWSLAEGDLVTITATVDEYFDFTELGYVEECDVIGSVPVPAPLPVTTAQLASSEALESCLVQVENVTISTIQDEYGQWFVTDGSGDCQIDDSFFYLEEVDPPIVLNVGDFYAYIVGLVDYSYDEYGLNPRYPEDLHTSAKDNNVISSKHVTLDGNYPNPFNPETRIAFSLEQETLIDLSIYDLQGRLVKTLYNGNAESGTHSLVWDGKDNQGNATASGVYFSRLLHSQGVETAKMILMK